MTPATPKLNGTRCLVLGGGGFIGTHLCAALLRQGARVQAFGHRPDEAALRPDIGWMFGDFTDRSALARAVEGVELVFHLLGSGTPSSSNRDPAADLAGYGVGSLHLLEICRKAAVRKIVFASSGGTVYGIPTRVPIPEDAATDPISAYGVSKLVVEKYLRLYRHLHGMDYAVLRIANPFGPHQHPDRGQGVVAALTQAILHGRPVEIWGDGRVVRDFLFIEDAVDAMVLAASYAGPHRVLNVGSGVGRSILEVIDDIGAVLGISSVPHHHLAGRPADVPVNVLDISLIGRELGWRPTTPWPDALRRTAAWLRDGNAPSVR